jgi:3-deoxy-D-manno-octulosonic-acid transferase
VLLYRVIMACLAPVLLAMTAFGRSPPGTLRQRLGFITPQQGRPWWVHGASLGELTSARAVITALATDAPVHVTMNTATAQAMVQGWALPGVSISLAPFDTLGAPGRMVARLHPRGLVMIENEFWPARIAACQKAGVPVMVISARISERSARRWGGAARLMRRVLGQITYLSAQDAASEARLVALGLPQQVLGARVNLKAGFAPRRGQPSPAQHPSRARTLLAASTHAGEDALILDAFLAARAQFDQIIIAPRHPDRGAEIATLIAARDLPFGQRARGAAIAPDQAVYLADTLGEMDLWYAMAGVTIIGGTFAPKGGHTPFEPTAFGAAIIHGPSLHNFGESFATLDAAGGAIAVQDGQALAAALTTLTPARQAQLATAAQGALAAETDIAGLIAALTHHRSG